MKSLSQSTGAARGSHKPPQDSQTGIISLPADADFNAVFDSSGEALLVADTTGVIHKFNERARGLLRIGVVDEQRQRPNRKPGKSRGIFDQRRRHPFGQQRHPLMDQPADRLDRLRRHPQEQPVLVVLKPRADAILQ